MDVKDFDYYLPKELIAQDPLPDRSSSRLLVLDRNTGETQHRHFTDILEYLNEGDTLVVNDTKVIPARLLGVKEETGAHVEVFLLNRKDDDIWECLVKPGKKLRAGARVSFGDGRLTCEIMEALPDGNRLVKFFYEGIFEEVLDALGEMPLPPYITHKLKDKDRYQTVYAKHEGSAAAPTAGLHFTNELLRQIEDRGVNIARVTLHVGLGTFRPVKVEKIEEHHMHTEMYVVNEETAELINRTVASGKKLVAVGTTSVRTLESASVINPEYEDNVENVSFTKEKINGISVLSDGNGKIIPKFVLMPGSSETGIFIYPGYEWKLVGNLITNFHLPQSTLIMLVSALAGRENILKAYEEAVSEKYRFFSFGDAMFIKE
ncbi:MAG: tRNA preQ1(34) S-adenosylmethionine ribosyltransferase-isomerase QueA [Lachnospiraceae bacterium]|nr:tRNA preQ1(34) S-adenosylmethionine ribosyltransferase-isomerase QueA [Lachnospiraceae bacterium]